MESGIIRKIRGNGIEFSFELNCKRNQEFGAAQIDHWWMPVTALYGQRGSSGPLHRNFEEILRLYWYAVQEQEATNVRDAQERFLLASLVPHVRAEGSRTIFADAFLRPMSQTKQKAVVRTFDQDILRPSKTTRLSRSSFSNQVWRLLGRTEYPDSIRAEYVDQLAHSLDEPCGLLADGDPSGAVQLVRKNWNNLMRQIGRRGGGAEKKIALNVISYECRAAFHHCYSVAWLVLISALQATDKLDQNSAAFLKQWHTVDEEPDSVCLFHGHAFALHPATGPFLLSRTGQELVGEWLSCRESIEAYEKLLNGIYLALMHYFEQRISAAEDRPRREISMSDPLVIEELQYDRQRGNRRQR